MINLPLVVKQETGSYCGPAVFEMLLANLGQEAAQKQIVEACKAEKTVMKAGIPLTDLAKGIEILFPHLQVWQKQNSGIDDIKKLVDNGYPVGVDWQGMFTEDEYGDEIWNTRDKIRVWWSSITKEPLESGDQGHYCIVVDVNLTIGYLQFIDPYGHYAGRERFISLWEFEERWWDDKLGQDEQGKKKVILENRLMFVVAPKTDQFLGTIGMERV